MFSGAIRMTVQPPKKTVLRRRQSLTATVEALLNGISMVVLAYVIAIRFHETFRLVDLYAVLALLIAMAVTYDALGVYRRHSGLLSKSINITKAWSISFSFVLVCGYFLRSLNDFFPPGEVALFAAAGLVIQLIIHWF